jgi:BirA family transcriptional regulator, biotin operon repressor / biotin---[acetyl-CoA-carboxylase] ligase
MSGLDAPFGAPLEGRAFRHIENVIYLPATASTNDIAKAIVEKMLAESEDVRPTIIVAGEQTAGHGRLGRSWVSLPESLAVSVIVPWPAGPERVHLPLHAGIALARGLSAAFALDVRLKWPNDLLVGRKKLGGILVEARANDEGEGWAIVGVGLNVKGTRSELDSHGLSHATSLEDAGVPAGKLEGVRPLSALLDILDVPLAEPGTEPLPEAFASVVAHAPGDTLSVQNGGRTVSGVYRGVNADGALRLETAHGEETVISGDVVLF